MSSAIVEGLVSFADRSRCRRKGYTARHDARALAGVFTAQASGLGSSATSIRLEYLAMGMQAPGRSTVYRNFQGLSEERATQIGTQIRGMIAGLHNKKLGGKPGVLISDEWDEVTTSRNQYTSSLPATPSGNRVKFTKLALKHIEASKEEGRPKFDAFRDARSFGHEYDRAIFVQPDGTRSSLLSFSPKEGNNVSPSKLLRMQNEVIRQRHAEGLRFTARVNDARWDDLDSTIALRETQDICPWVTRHREMGPPRDARPSYAAKVRRRQRAKCGGPASRSFAVDSWPQTVSVPGQRNARIAFQNGPIFREDPGRSTRIVVWRPKRGYRFKRGDTLRPWENIFPTFFITSLPATLEGALEALRLYDIRWDVEEDIRHHKRYRKLGSGSEMRTRALYLQASEIMKAIIHYVHKFGFQWVGKTHVQFQDTYNRATRQLAVAIQLAALPPGQLSTPPKV